MPIFIGIAFGALYKLCSSVIANGKQVSLGLWEHGWDGFYTLTGKLDQTAAYAKSKTTFYLGAELSPALLGVGTSLDLESQVLYFSEGLGAIFISPVASSILNPTDLFISYISSEAANGNRCKLWRLCLTYEMSAGEWPGVGTMLVGGLYTLVAMREALIKGITEMFEATKQVVSEKKMVRNRPRFTCKICCNY